MFKKIVDQLPGGIIGSVIGSVVFVTAVEVSDKVRDLVFDFESKFELIELEKAQIAKDKELIANIRHNLGAYRYVMRIDNELIKKYELHKPSDDQFAIVNNRDYVIELNDAIDRLTPIIDDPEIKEDTRPSYIHTYTRLNCILRTMPFLTKPEWYDNNNTLEEVRASPLFGKEEYISRNDLNVIIDQLNATEEKIIELFKDTNKRGMKESLNSSLSLKVELKALRYYSSVSDQEREELRAYIVEQLQAIGVDELDKFYINGNILLKPFAPLVYAQVASVNAV